MAEKEERIYLFTDKLICENCKDWYEHIDPLDSPDCKECAPADFPYITRQEAIERMKNADIKNHWECQKQGRRPTDEEAYGAMLDALIEKSLCG